MKDQIIVRTENSTYTLTPGRGKSWTLTSNNPWYAGPIKIDPPTERDLPTLRELWEGRGMVLSIQPGQGYKGFLITSRVESVTLKGKS